MKENIHTDRFSNRNIPQVIDLELLHQLILRRWEFHCGEEEVTLAQPQSPPPGFELDIPAKALPPPFPPSSL